MPKITPDKIKKIVQKSNAAELQREAEYQNGYAAEFPKGMTATQGRKIAKTIGKLLKIDVTEYIDEGENQDGNGYWKQFTKFSDLQADIKLYFAESTEETTPTGAAIKKFTKVETKKATLDETGTAILLAQLAEDLGMHVPDVANLPERLKEANLPTKLERWQIDLAHRLNRNAIEASLWRNNRPMTEKAPTPSWEKAKAEIAKPSESQQFLDDLKAKKAKAEKSFDEKNPPTSKPSKSTSEKAPSTRTQVFGFAATAVVRALGKKGIAFDKVKTAMAKQGVSLSDSTLKIQLRAGQTGDAARGEPAKLTPTQEKQLLS